MKVDVTYNTTLPLQGLNPKVSIVDDYNNVYFVVFIDRITGNVIASGSVESNKWIAAKRQWFTWWRINVYKGKEKVYTEDFNPYGKNVFIKIDAKALGDNLAWMPYVEEFRIKHKCNVICSTFFNDLFKDEYRDILFIQPWTEKGKVDNRISNIYATYYVGTQKPDNYAYSPRPYGKIRLQETASDILGLEFREIKAKITRPIIEKTKSVCISTSGSSIVKEWNGRWQDVVDYLISEGYEVKAIGKERTDLHGVINKTGDFPLSERISDLCQAQFFIGISSGLSWLAHSCNTYVYIVSDHTPKDHEFSENCTRIYSEKCRKEVIQQGVDSGITPMQIIEEIKKKKYLALENIQQFSY